MTVSTLSPAESSAERRKRIAEIVLERAVHESAHAVFQWRGMAILHGENWIEDWPPFEEIVVSPDVDEWKNGKMVSMVQPIKLRDGKLVDVAGIVAGRPQFRMTVTMAREIASGLVGLADGTTRLMPRARQRAMIRRTKLETKLHIQHTVAGPIAGEWDHENGFSDWNAFDQLSDEEICGPMPSNGGDRPADTDASAAYKLAMELCNQNERQAWRAVEEIEEEVASKLRDDPRYWRAIRALADALVNHRRHRLSGDAAIKVMQRAWN